MIVNRQDLWQPETVTRLLLLNGAAFFLCLFLSDVPLVSHAQNDESVPLILPVDQLTSEMGLPSDLVMKSHQDRKGFMWFVTFRGLVKYDGYDFVVYQNQPKNPNSLSCDELYDLVEDDDGVFWIASKEGLNRFDSKTGTFKRFFHHPNDPESLRDHTIIALLKDSRGRLWIGTGYGGLHLYDRERESFQAFQHDDRDPQSLSSNRISCLSESPSGKIWVGTLDNNGIWDLFDPETQKCQHYTYYNADTRIHIHDVISLLSQPDGTVWCGTWGHGLYRFNPSDGIYKVYLRYSHDTAGITGGIVQCIVPNRQGRFWIGTREDGLKEFDPIKEQFRTITLVDKRNSKIIGDTIYHVYEDRSGSLWICTLNNGVCRYDKGGEQFLTIKNVPENPDSLAGNRVYALCARRDGSIWIGTHGSGLNRYDPTTGKVSRFIHDPSDSTSLPGNTVVSLLEDSHSNLWVGSWNVVDGAFSRFIPETGTFRRYRHDPERPGGMKCLVARTLMEDRTGKIWIGTDGTGINVFDPGTELFKVYYPNESGASGLTESFVNCLLEDRAGTIWVGGQNDGLFRYDRERDHFDPYPLTIQTPGIPSSYNIFSLYEDRKDNLWVGTNKGLFCLDPGRVEILFYTMDDGLADTYVKGILEDSDGFLWLGHDNGKMTRFHPNSRRFQNYDRGDGLQGMSFNPSCAVANASGELYFGGLNGVNCVRPGRLTKNTQIPPIVITRFEIMDKPYPFEPALTQGETILLDHRSNYFYFEFAALNFIHPQKNQYAYRLTPLETDWNVSGNRRFAQYTALEPGQYRFEVKGSNNDGVWNETGVSLPIYIRPPLWRTWWFQSAAGGILVCLLVLGYFYRIRSLERHKERLEREVEKRTHLLHQANQTLDILSKQDALTKTANRRCFDEMIDLEWRRALRNQSCLSLIFCDVDLFKLYNDCLGHLAGDECLQAIANLFQQNIKRPGDIVARYGGEEFVILLVDTDPEGAYQFASQLRRQIESLAMPHPQSDISPYVTISLGVASIIPRADISPQKLIQAADDALYLSKQEGRNRVSTAVIPDSRF